MKYFVKVFLHDRVVLALNGDKETYLNFETSTNGNTFGNICECFHGSQGLNFFGELQKFKYCSGGYTRVKFREMEVAKDNSSVKLKVNDEGHLLASASVNMLTVDKSYQHLSGTTIHWNVKGRRRKELVNVLELLPL